MNRHLRSLACWATLWLCHLGSGVILAATRVTTTPVGFMRFPIAAAVDAAHPTNQMNGLAVARPVEYQGQADQITPGSLVDHSSQWKDGQFEGSHGAYYVEVTSGPWAGLRLDITQTLAASHTLQLAQLWPSTLGAGFNFNLRPHYTIGGIFGSHNEAGLLSGTEPAQCDEIYLRRDDQTLVFFYYTPAVGSPGWRRVDDLLSDQSATVIYPENAIGFMHPGLSPRSYSVMGQVRTGPLLIPITPGLNAIAYPSPVPTTLRATQLYTGDPTTGMAIASPWDSFWLRSGTLSVSYWLNPGPLFHVGWVTATDLFSDAGLNTIPVGAGLLIRRHLSPGFNWFVPAPNF